MAEMGTRAEPPPLPELPPNLDPTCTAMRRMQECSYLQALEGNIDTVHAASCAWVTSTPGLDFPHFFGCWREKHSVLASRLPGRQRYTQNHAYPPAYARAGMTHHGWFELWFDDYASFDTAVRSPEWASMEADARTVICAAQGHRHRDGIRAEGRELTAARLQRPAPERRAKQGASTRRRLRLACG